MGQYHAGLTAFITMITVVVIVVGAVLLSNGTMNAPDLITFLLYISNFTEPVQKLINFTEQFQNGITGYERFREILSIDPEIKECENRWKQKISEEKWCLTMWDSAMKKDRKKCLVM